MYPSRGRAAKDRPIPTASRCDPRTSTPPSELIARLPWPLLSKQFFALPACHVRAMLQTLLHEGTLVGSNIALAPTTLFAIGPATRLRSFFISSSHAKVLAAEAAPPAPVTAEPREPPRETE